MSDSHLFVVYGFDPADLKKVAQHLEALELLVPGYIPPKVGLYSPESFLFDHINEGIEFYIAPDRNIASRMMQIAMGKPYQKDHRPAALLMAFAQALEINFEPSIAFHELAYKQGNDVALHELAWFRAADKENPQAWIDLALGRQATFSFSEPKAVATMNLAFPLTRWRRNYIAMLEIGHLELQKLSPFERMIRLMSWMENDFYVAGPALLFAAYYLSPRFPKKGMLKQLRSPHRANALEGAANAAWDITYISDFTHRINSERDEKIRHLFATSDESLRKVAAALFAYSTSDNSESMLRQLLEPWWSVKEAAAIATATTRLLALMQEDRSTHLLKLNSLIDTLTKAGEEKLIASFP